MTEKHKESVSLDPQKNFVIEYADGTKEIAKAVSWIQLDDVETLQLAILENAYEKNFSLGSIFRKSNNGFWDNAKKLAGLIPIVGNEEPGFDPTKIEDMDHLFSIFISTTQGRNYKAGSIDVGESTIEPSLICKIHYLNFIQLLVQIEESKKS